MKQASDNTEARKQEGVDRRRIRYMQRYTMGLNNENRGTAVAGINKMHIWEESKVIYEIGKGPVNMTGASKVDQCIGMKNIYESYQNNMKNATKVSEQRHSKVFEKWRGPG